VRVGWIEGRSIVTEYRWAEGRSERFAEFAAEFVRLKVDIIVIVFGASDGAQMALVLASPFFLPHLAQIVELAKTHRVPSMFIAKHWVQGAGSWPMGSILR
jgi:hypothetical protein